MSPDAHMLQTCGLGSSQPAAPHALHPPVPRLPRERETPGYEPFERERETPGYEPACRAARLYSPQTRLTNPPGQWLQCQANGSNVYRVLRPVTPQHLAAACGTLSPRQREDGVGWVEYG